MTAAALPLPVAIVTSPSLVQRGECTSWQARLGMCAPAHVVVIRAFRMRASASNYEARPVSRLSRPILCVPAHGLATNGPNSAPDS